MNDNRERRYMYAVGFYLTLTTTVFQWFLGTAIATSTQSVQLDTNTPMGTDYTTSTSHDTDRTEED